MREYEVISRNNYTYILRCNIKDYKYNLEFYDFYVDVGDILYFPPGMFNNEKVLCFGDVKSIYGKDMNKYTRDDLLIIKKGNDIYYLKRYYG